MSERYGVCVESSYYNEWSTYDNTSFYAISCYNENRINFESDTIDRGDIREYGGAHKQDFPSKLIVLAV